MASQRRGAGTCLHALLVVAISSFPALADAQNLSPIVDRAYAIDLYQGAVLGSARIVAMGGASVAVAEGSAGILNNPASVAAWPATSTGQWDWDFHFDALNRLPGSDLDNNGVEDPEPELELSPFGTGGLIGRWGILSIGVTGSTNAEALPGEAMQEDDVVAETSIIRIAAGASLFRETLALGIAAKVGQFSIQERDGNQKNPLFALEGTGLEVGAIWSPLAQSFRVGASASFPFSGEKVKTDDCDPLNCQGFILPNKVEAPWLLAVGGAWRWGQTPWNQKYGTRWRDEKYVLVAADLLVTGTSPDGHGIGAFAQKQLQPSGRDVSLSARLGAEYEWLPGRLRVRGGTYWEPGRFEGVSGRLHVTLGFEVRVFTLRLWSYRYRVKVGLIGDGAEGYGNTGVSVGFWH